MATAKPLKVGASGPKEFATSDTIPAANLPAPTGSTLGGVESFTAPSHQFINEISTAGVPSSAQPAYADISGLGTAAEENLSSVIIDNGSGALTIGTGEVTTGMIGSGAVTLTTQVTGVLPPANGGSGVNTVPSNGELLIGDTATGLYVAATPGASNTIQWTTGAGTLSAAVVEVPSPCPVSNNADTAIARTSAGVLEVDNGTAGTWGLLNTGAQTIQRLATPAAPTITQGGSGASTHYTYAVSAVLADGATQTSISTGTQTTGGASTLNGTNYNIITWSAVTGATSYNIYRIASSGTPASTGLIGNTTGTTFHDTGIAGTTIWPNLNATGMLNAASNIYNGGRLYLVSGSPFADGSTSGNSTLYYGPCPNLGNLITLDNGSGVLQTFSFSEISLPLTSTGGDAYDVYIYNNSGSLSFTTTVWSNTTTPPSRSTDAAGRLTKSGATNYLLVGAFYAAGTNTAYDVNVPGTMTRRHVSNVFNTINKSASATNPSSTWTVASSVSSFRAQNTNTTDGQGRLSFFQVLAINIIPANAITLTTQTTGGISATGIGLDSTTVLSGVDSIATTEQNCFAIVNLAPQLGYHYVQKLEANAGTANIAFYGTGTGINDQLSIALQN